MKHKVLTVTALLLLAACGRSGKSTQPTAQQKPSAQPTAVSEVVAMADFEVEGSWMYFRNVDPGKPEIKRKAGDQFIYCDSYLPDEESQVNYSFGENLQTLTVGNPLTLFALKDMRRQGMADPSLPLVGVWEGQTGDGKTSIAQKYVLQIVLGKEGYEFHLKKTCSAEINPLN